MKLMLNEKVFDYMLAHAEEDYPNECCGFFYGSDGEVRKVSRAQKVTNSQDGNQRKRFRIDPEDYRKAEKFARNHDLDLLGVYHSHPDHPAVPSEHDRKVAMPYFSYIIVSVEKGKASDTRSWRLNEERRFDEELLESPRISKNTK